MNPEKKKRTIFLKNKKTAPYKKSLNELPVLSIDPKLTKWINIIHPTKSSLHTERME